jgi:HTH-type transcriptional regulator, glycine betaine synthesis regulator
VNPPSQSSRSFATSSSEADGSSPTIQLSQSGESSLAKNEIVEICADAVQQFGLARSVGQIFGAIYVSPHPLAFADVLAALNLSKGSVSQGLRFLRELGAIKRFEIADDGREYFVPETEIRRLLSALLQARVRAPLESGGRRLERLQRVVIATEDPDRDFLRQRLSSLQAWHRNALFALPLIQRFLGRRLG